MNFPKLLPGAGLFGAVCLSVAGVSTAAAQTSAATDPVGFTTASMPANSDSLISIPFTRPAAFTGTIASISGNTITVAASPGWTNSQFVYASGSQSNTYYAIIGPNFAPVTGTVSATNGSVNVTGSGSSFTQMVAGDEILINGNVATVAAVTSATALTLVSPFIGATVSGATATFDHSPKEGSFYTVTANGSNTLTVNLNGDSLASIASSLGNTSVSLIPYWTLGTAFPSTDAGTSFVASTGAQPRNRQTQILLPDQTNPGIDLAPTGLYYYLGSNWTSDGSTSANDVVLPPGTFFTVRNAGTATTFTPTGNVYMNRVAVALDTRSGGAQDNPVSFLRPTATTLNDLGLISTGAFLASTGDQTRNRTDTLLVYDNTVVGTDKGASAIYYYYGGIWRLSGATTPSTDYGSTPIPYGTGFRIRKAATSQGTTAFWQNIRNY